MKNVPDRTYPNVGPLSPDYTPQWLPALAVPAGRPTRFVCPQCGSRGGYISGLTYTARDTDKDRVMRVVVDGDSVSNSHWPADRTGHKGDHACVAIMVACPMSACQSYEVVLFDNDGAFFMEWREKHG